MVKGNTMINESFLKSISKIRSKNLYIDEMDELIVEIFQHGIDLSKAYCEAVRRANEEDELKSINSVI